MSDAEVLGSTRVHDGRVVRLCIDRVRLPNGKEAELEVVRHRGAAAVVPLDAERHVLLVNQYRYAAGGWLLEVPAGKLDGETPEACAAREIREEVGRQAGRLVSMGWIWTTPGFADERIWLYLATELEPARQDLEDDEILSVVRMPLERAVSLARRGEIRDAKSICSLLRVAEFL